MAKTQTAGTLSPTSMILGAPVFFEHGQAVIEQANWTFGNRPQTHVNQSCGGSITGVSGEPEGLNIVFRAVSAGPVEVLRFYIKILPETVNLTVGVETSFASTEEGTVTVVVGSTSTGIAFTASDDFTEKAGTLATSATGTGWQLCTVSIEKTVEVPTAAELIRVRIQDQSITSALPSPTIEGDSFTMDVQDEGLAAVLSAQKLNFVGSGVAATSGGSGIATITVSGGSGSTLPVVDTTAVVKGSADDTKQLKLEVDGLTTSTTRTWTAPDQDVDLTPNTGTFPGTGRLISTGDGLSGGGDLSADRTLALDINGLAEDTAPTASADFVAAYIAGTAMTKKVLLNKLGAALDQAILASQIFG